MQHVAADLRVKQDGHDVERGAGEAIGGRHRAEGVGEEEKRRAEEARPQHRDRDMAPILPARRAEHLGRLAPFALQPVERRRQDQHHQRDLEIEIGEGEPGEAQHVEAGRIEVEAEIGVEERGHEAGAPERREEGEGERQAREIRGDAAKGHQRRAQPARQAAEHDGRGEKEAEDRAAEAPRRC